MQQATLVSSSFPSCLHNFWLQADSAGGAPDDWDGPVVHLLLAAETLVGELQCYIEAQTLSTVPTSSTLRQNHKTNHNLRSLVALSPHGSAQRGMGVSQDGQSLYARSYQLAEKTVPLQFLVSNPAGPGSRNCHVRIVCLVFHYRCMSIAKRPDISLVLFRPPSSDVPGLGSPNLSPSYVVGSGVCPVQSRCSQGQPGCVPEPASGLRTWAQSLPWASVTALRAPSGGLRLYPLGGPCAALIPYLTIHT